MVCLTNDVSIGRHVRALAAVAALVVAPLSARAQSRGSGYGGPPAPAPAPEPPGPVNVVHRNAPAAGERMRHGRRSYPLTSSAIAAYGYVPVVVTADGRVFADLGYGFMPIERACGFGATIAEPQGATSGYTPPTMITPTPLNPEEASRQAAAAAAAARAGAAGDSVSRGGAPASCWARDAAGYLYIGRQ